MAINARKEDRKKQLEKTRPSVKEQIRQQLDADLGRTTTATTSSGGGAKTTTTSGGTTKASGQTSSVKADIRALLDADLGRTTKKDKWDSFWKGVGKNVKAGATDSSLKNQAQYYAHNDPIREKYRHNTVVNGKESTFTVDRSLNPDYLTTRFLDRALDPQHRVGRESNQGTIYTQEEANRDIQALDEYRARQDVRDYEADVATQQALQTIDPDTKVGQIAVAASMGVARTLPALAKDAALTATTAGLLGAAGFGKTAIRLAKEIPTLTVRTLRYYDDAFQNALNNGATEEQAVRAAMQTALPNAAIESAGGLDALAGKIGMKAGMQTAKAAFAAAKTGRQPWTSYVGKAMKAGASLSKTGFEEGAEEVAQGLIERGATNRNYDQNTLVWDINQIADDFGMGFMGGILMGGALKMAGGVVDSTSKKQLADDIKAEAASQGVVVSDAEANQIADRVADAAVKSQTEQQPAVEEQAPIAPQAAPQEQQEALQPVQQYETNEKGETILPVSSAEAAQKAESVQQTQPGQTSDISALHHKASQDTLTEEEFDRLIEKEGLNKTDDVDLLWTAPKDNGGWKQVFNGGNPTYDALRIVDPKLFQAFQNEAQEDSTNFPITFAYLAVWEDVRQGTISPMAGAQYLSNIYRAGGEAALKKIYNGASGNLYASSLEEIKNIDAAHIKEAVNKTVDNLFGNGQGTDIGAASQNASEPLASAENGTVGQDFNILTPEGLGREYTSEFRTNTVEKAIEQQRVTQEMAEDLDSRFKRLPNDQLEEAAKDYVEGHDSSELLGYLQNKVTSGLNTLEQAIAMELSLRFQQEGKQEQATAALQVVQNSVHMAGQMVQSVILMSRVGPELLQEQARANAVNQNTKIHESRLQAMGVLGDAIAKASEGKWDGNLDTSKIEAVPEKTGQELGITATGINSEKGFVDDTGLTEKQVKRLEKRAKWIYDHSKGTGISTTQWLSYLALATQAEGVATSFSGTSRAWATTAMLAQLKTLLTRSLTGNASEFSLLAAANPAAISISNGLRALFNVEGRRSHGGTDAFWRGAKQGINTAAMAWATGTLDIIGNKYNESKLEEPGDLNRLGGPSEALPWQVFRTINDAVHFALTVIDQPFRRGMESAVLDQYERGNTKTGADFSAVDNEIKAKDRQEAGAIITRYGPENIVNSYDETFTQRGKLSRTERITANLLGQAINSMIYDGTMPHEAALEILGYNEARLSPEQEQAVADLENQLAAFMQSDNKKLPALETLNTIAKGRNVSQEQAEQAEYMGSETTFQNESTGYQIASQIRGIGRKILGWGERKNNTAAKVFGRGLDLVLKTAQPFVQVFGNQLSAIMEFTPLNSVLGLGDLVAKSIAYKNGKVVTEQDVTSISNRIARGIIGGAVLGVAMLLRGKGILSGEEPEDDLEAAIWKQNGIIPNSFKIGNTYYDYSNIGPALVLLNIGAAVYDQLDDEGMDDVTKKEIVTTILNACGFYALEDVTNDQGWEGIMERMEQIGEQDFEGIATSTIGSYIRQRYPQLLSQIAAFRDPYKRDVSAHTEKERWINQIIGGIPGRSEELPAKRDVLGRELERYPNSSKLGRAWGAFLDPSQRQSVDISDNKVLSELSDLARATDDKSLLLGNAPYTMDGYKLSGQERNALMDTYNGGVADVLEKLLQDDDYTSLSVDEKHTIVDNAETLLWYQARKQLADGSKGEYTIAENAAGKKMAEKADKAWDDQKIDLPTYLIYSMEMNKDYSLKYTSQDEIPVYKSGKNKGQPKGEVGDIIDSGKKKGAALAIQQKFGDDLTVDQRYYLWTLASPSGDSAWKEVRDGGTDNDYYRYFAEGWDEDTLRNL